MSGAVVVTGVSTGIGRAVARALVQRGFRVFGSVRRSEDAAPLAAPGGRFTPLVFDVTDAAAIRRAAEEVARTLGGRTLAGLVNNAGIAVAGPLEHLAPDELRRQLEVNLVGPLAVTQAFLPLLGADPARAGPPGRIVNLGSGAARSCPPFLGPYVASKRALEGLSDSLRRELLVHGIDVVVVVPGFVATPIWDKAEAMDVSSVEGTVYQEAARRFQRYMLGEGRAGHPPERVAESVCEALTAARPKACYAVVKNRLRDWILPRLLPARTLDRMVGRGLGLLPPRGGGAPGARASRAMNRG